MTVFKHSILLFRRKFFMLSLYVCIFFGVMILTTANIFDPVEDFASKKLDIAIINHDQGNPISDGLVTMLNQHSNVKDDIETKEDIQNFIYFQEIKYALIIPEGYGESVLNNGNITLERIKPHDSVGYINIDMLCNEYISSYQLYQQADFSNSQIHEMIMKDLDQDVSIQIEGSEKHYKSLIAFNYMSYAFLSVMITGIGLVSLSMSKRDLKMRNQCAPTSNLSIQLQLNLSYICFALLAWAAIILPSLLLLKDEIFTIQGFLYIVHSLIFLLPSIAIAYLVSIFAKSEEVVSALCNIIALGTSFISGVFIQQEFLSASVIQLASFTPTYWFVKGNNAIYNIGPSSNIFNAELLSSIAIELLFAIALFTIAMVISKRKKTF